MTSEYPYPGQPSGPDGNPQADPYDAPGAGSSRPRYEPDSPTPFAAFGEAGEDGSDPGAPASTPQASTPPAVARAAVRMPPGLIVSAPPATPEPPAQRGQVYGRPDTPSGGGGGVYGSSVSGVPAEPALPSRSGSSVYGAPAQRIYGQPYGGAPDESSAQVSPAGPTAPASAQAAVAQASVAQASMAQGRPIVPAQRGPTVYGQRQATPPEPAPAAWPAQPEYDDRAPQYGGSQFDPPPREPFGPPPHERPQYDERRDQYDERSVPRDQYDDRPPQREPYGERSAPQYDNQFDPASRESAPRQQFEQHGRQTQDPFGAARPDSAPPSRVGSSWQDQLQPMVSLDQSRGPRLGASAPTPADVAVIPAPPRSNMRIVRYVGIVVLIIGLAVAALVYTSRTDPPKVGDCVQQSGNGGSVAVSCSTSGAFKVTHSVTKVSDCPDYLNEPSLNYKKGSTTVILCLEPAS